MSTILGFILDELVSAAQRNSVDGPPPEHWYPPAKVRKQLSLAEHTCKFCRRFDPTHRRITVPYCPGRPPE